MNLTFLSTIGLTNSNSCSQLNRVTHKKKHTSYDLRQIASVMEAICIFSSNTLQLYPFVSEPGRVDLITKRVT